MTMVIHHKPHKHHVHAHHIDSDKLQLELGALMGIFATVLLFFTLGGTHGRTAALVLAVPMIFFFRWMALPVVHMINEEEDDEQEWTTDEEEPHPEVIEHIPPVVFDDGHHGVHARITGTKWICVCGTHNPLDREAKIQNCSRCYRCRDFVLKNYS